MEKVSIFKIYRLIQVEEMDPKDKKEVMELQDHEVDLEIFKDLNRENNNYWYKEENGSLKTRSLNNP